jgi:proline iminopeptidase
LLEDTAHLADIPGVIVQGRYDMVTPPRTAWELAKAWPGVQLNFVPDAGHAAGEPGTVDGLVRATDMFARRFG